MLSIPKSSPGGIPRMRLPVGTNLLHFPGDKAQTSVEKMYLLVIPLCGVQDNLDVKMTQQNTDFILTLIDNLIFPKDIGSWSTGPVLHVRALWVVNFKRREQEPGEIGRNLVNQAAMCQLQAECHVCDRVTCLMS